MNFMNFFRQIFLLRRTSIAKRRNVATSYRPAKLWLEAAAGVGIASRTV
jgi:hypothetical protein